MGHVGPVTRKAANPARGLWEKFDPLLMSCLLWIVIVMIVQATSLERHAKGTWSMGLIVSRGLCGMIWIRRLDASVISDAKGGEVERVWQTETSRQMVLD